MNALCSSILSTMMPIQFRGNPGRRQLYLTFDDGPSPNTPKLLDMLERHGVKATFFILGKRIVDRESILTAIFMAGHRIGNHSFSHASARTLSYSALLDDMDRCAQEIRRVLPQWDSVICRPPYGDLSVGFIRYAVAREQRIVMWSKDAVDYRAPTTDAIDARLRDVHDGDIILFHDEFLVTQQALEQLIPYWKGKGHEFAAL
ncbi:MAG: Peptidoglycan-N-acetylmuramic acid deacetylase PdaA [Gammaproteobacteria bacterium]|nr:Peptidoglycan-N-acetylmuramic acid deacetylase PdaA [Gammaproteobacteria bacterium]